MPLHYPSVNKHFFSLSKHDNLEQDRYETEYETYNQSIVYCRIEIRNLVGVFGMHVKDSFLDGMYQNLPFKTFRKGCFA